jgi:anthranilate 1,2-dioxygenase (deaminating, decarboxylating) large subunit
MAYHSPNVNLGASNILDGGPLRPQPGWYLQEFLQGSTTNRFLDSKGNVLGNPSPTHHTLVLVNNLIYQSPIKILNANLGFSSILPVKLYSKVSQNYLDIRDSGAGFGDLGVGIFLQWTAMNQKHYPKFIHRLEFDAYSPTGKYDGPIQDINPSNGYGYMNGYWSATLFLTPNFAVSNRFTYAWSQENRSTHIKSGSLYTNNFSLEYQAAKELWVGPVGYYLRKFKNDTLNGITIPDSCEQVLGIGPGILYSPTKNLHLFSYLYFENNVKNRPQETRVIARLLYYLGR